MKKVLSYLLIPIQLILLIFNISILVPVVADYLNGSMIGFAFSLPILLFAVPLDLLLSAVSLVIAKSKGLKWLVAVSIIFLIISIICTAVTLLIYIKGV